MQDIKTREYAVAELLDRSAMALAGYATEQLVGQSANGAPISDRFHFWQSYLASRLRDLSAAVHLGRPGLFARQIRWCWDALAAKDLDPTEFKEALEVLAGVIETEVDKVGPRIADTYVRAAIASLDQLSDNGLASLLDSSQPTGKLAASYMLAVLEGDRRRAADLIHQAVDDGMPVRQVYLDVLAPASREIGLMWHRDEVGIAEEHFATATTQMVMSQLLRRSPVPALNGKTVVVASVMGDRHGLGTQLVADCFELDGWRVVYLGPDIPGQELPQALIDFQADLLLLSATLYTHLRALESTIAALQVLEETRSVPVLVGGHAFAEQPDLAEQIGADDYAADADAAVSKGRKLVGLGESC